ncbi:MAG: MauE/DoxX family redox-associated membrane protein, partial [Planctomycetota bacterium]
MGHQWALRFSRFWAVSLLALLFSTMRLWWPLNTPAIATYPAVPSVELLTLPAWCDALFVPLFASAVIVFFSRLGPPRSKISIGWAIIGLAIAVGIADDQHRMQPWVLQTGFYSIILACLPSNEALRPIRAIAISIYAYSAAGKLDYQFIHTVGQDFLGSAVGVVGLETTQWPESIRTAGAFAFPVSELIVAGLLAWPRTRRIGGVFAMLLHASLIVLLSPWVMGHSLGVLIWNGVLIGQSWFLFLTPMEPALSPLSTSKRAVQPSDAGWRRTIAITTSCVAVSMPLAERSGYWD